VSRESKNFFRQATRSLLISLAALACLALSRELVLAQLSKPKDIPAPISSKENGDGTKTFTFRDQRYGSDGEREETIDSKGRFLRRTWKDSKGRVLEEETTTYGKGDQKTVNTMYLNPLPNGQVVKGRETITKTDTAGNEIETEIRIFDRDSGLQIDGSKTQIDDNGKRKTFRFDAQNRKYVEEVPSVASRTSGGSSSAARGFAVASDTVSGLNTTTFDTPKGKIYVNLPDDISAGDTLSGTVVAEPEGQDDKTRTRNQGELAGYVVQLENQQSSSVERLLKLSIPATINTTYLILKDKNGKEVARSDVPVGKQQATAPQEFGLPTIGQQGRPVEVTGNFDGDSGTTNLMLGDEELQILAESPRKLVARNTSNKVGVNQLVVREQGRTAVGQFRSIGLSLSAPKLDLLRGEQTTLTVKVFGLEGIKSPVPLVLENRSPGVIQMGGANRETIMISPSQVQAGTYTTQRPLTGIQRGGFTIVGTVTRDEQ
jgi:hypothetical protein